MQLFLPFHRSCVSYDPLVPPHQLLNHPDWLQLNAGICLPPSVAVAAAATAKKLYACSSDCSDHSLKSHSLHSQHSINAASGGGGSGCCASNTTVGLHCKARRSSSTTGHGHSKCGHHNIYENDENDEHSLECCPSERDTMLTSGGGGDGSGAPSTLGDCSCNESIYAEADDPKLMPPPSETSTTAAPATATVVK